MNNTVRKHPRSLEEAFGPYTSPRIDEPARHDDKIGASVALAIMIGIGIAAGLVHWWSS